MCEEKMFTFKTGGKNFIKASARPGITYILTVGIEILINLIIPVA